MQDRGPPVGVLAGVLVAVPGRHVVENSRSAVTCQNVTNGSQTTPGRTSLPGGSSVQAGSERIEVGLHHTMGSEGCIRYRTRLPCQGWPSGGIAGPGSLVNRTVRPRW